MVFLPLLVFAEHDQNKCQKWTEDINIVSLLSIIKSNKNIQTVEDVICRLPESVLENYTLVGKSASAQSSSLRHPRVIMFKKRKDSKIDFLMSFNGNKDDTNYKHIELLKINRTSQQTKSLEYIDINFDKDETGRRVSVSKANPPECMQCHGIYHDKPRPIWDAECFFPTSYNRMKLTSGDSIPRVTNDLKEFLGIVSEHHRYKELKPLAESPDEVLKEIVSNNNFIYRDLADINLDRVVNLILKTSNFDIFKYSIAAALLGCENIDSYITTEWLKKINTDYINLDYKGNETVFKDYLGDTERKVDPVTWSCTRVNVNAIASFRWLIEGRGISMEEWAMDTPINGNISFYRFIGRGLGTEAIAIRLIKKDMNLKSILGNQYTRVELKKISDNFPEEALNNYGLEKMTQVCSSFKKESLIKLSKYPPQAKSEAKPKLDSRIPSNAKKK